MAYFGNLAPALSGVAKRLEPGGFYLFANEAKAGEGWAQTMVHRFRHGEVYLRAAAAGLQFVDIRHVRYGMRNTSRFPVSP